MIDYETEYEKYSNRAWRHEAQDLAARLENVRAVVATLRSSEEFCERSAALCEMLDDIESIIG